MVRLRKSFWLEFICFKPIISKEHMHQAATLASTESNPVDECTQLLADLISTQDFANVNLILEGLSSIHYDKVKYG